MPKREDEPTQEPTPLRPEANASPPEAERGNSELMGAMRGLLDALDRCAGDPPDCPHCGPARSLALYLLEATEYKQSQPTSEQERVRLSGRVGADPAFRTTPNGTVIGRFPLAVHEDNRTTWHTILAFNHRAEALRESVKRGVAVNVVGYTHSREAPSRGGSARTINEIYAVTVTTPEAQ